MKKIPVTGAPTPTDNLVQGGEKKKKKKINEELWQACAGPLVNLPAPGTHVVYFPQGHSEQVAASMKKDVDAQIPNYPNLPSKLLCLLHEVTLHADPETDEVYAQMTLQPVPSFDKDALLRSDLSMKANRPQTEFFCKALTASDTSTHGGFSVPRRAAEKMFPHLDFTRQPPAQELVARDLHDNLWTFRHIYRGQPKRHLLTTGWSLFVSGKRLFAGDSVLFIRDEKHHLLLGIRRANRQPTNLSSSVLSSDCMHIGVLAAAAHAAANNSPFAVFYNPRASPSEFVIPLAKYYKAVCSNQISLGMRFRMMFETEESGTRRYMGTITGISDLDPVRWRSSQWRNLQVGWDESTAGERRNRVSVWEIEPVTAPFFICPSPPFYRSKRPRIPGMPGDDETSDLDSLFKRTMPRLGDDMYMKDPQSLPGLSLVQWMNMQQTPPVAQQNYINSLSGSTLQNLMGADPARQLGLPPPQIPMQNIIQFNGQKQSQHQAQIDQLQKPPSSNLNPVAQITDTTQQTKQNMINQNLPSSQIQDQIMHSQGLIQTQNIIQQQQQQQPSIQNQLVHKGLSQSFSQNLTPAQMWPDQVNQQQNMSENQIQLQLLCKLQQPQQALLAHQSSNQLPQVQDQQRQIVDASQSFSRSTMPSQFADMPQAAATSLPLSHLMPQQMSKTSIQPESRFSHPSQQIRYQSQPQQQQQSAVLSDVGGCVGLNPLTNQLSTNGSNLLTGVAGGGPSGITDDVPSCSTSPSTNNGLNSVQPNINTRVQRSMALGGEEMRSSNQIESMSGVPKSGIRPSINISKSQNQGHVVQPSYPTAIGVQMDYLDSTSGTSVCLSQNDVHLHQANNPMAFNQQSVMFRDRSHHHDIELDGDSGNNSVQFRANMSGGVQLGMPVNHDPLLAKDMVRTEKDFTNTLSTGDGMLSNYDGLNGAQPQLSSSLVSPSFGVPDMAFGSIDSPINDGSFINRGGWAPTPQFQRKRTYTKVYKRGAVGRSIDMSRYVGYEELKRDLACMFGIEGQLEDKHRVGWKLVYVDHESDVLLVGDDPWEEFVNCVRCIKILSPQEVQALSLDVDLGNNVLPNQAGSSSNGGNL